MGGAVTGKRGEEGRRERRDVRGDWGREREGERQDGLLDGDEIPLLVTEWFLFVYLRAGW